MTWSYMLIHWLKLSLEFYTDPLGVIEDAPICNGGIFRDLTQCDVAKSIILIVLSFNLRRF